jgi:hypothetical protein
MGHFMGDQTAKVWLGIVKPVDITPVGQSHEKTGVVLVSRDWVEIRLQCELGLGLFWIILPRIGPAGLSLGSVNQVS